MLRVVTCCAVPASVFLTVQDSDSASSWYGEGATLWTWIIIAAVSTLVLGGLICLFYRTYLSCRRKHCEQEALVTCHLCTRRVPASSWRQGRAPRTPAPTSPCQCRDTCHVSSVLVLVSRATCAGAGAGVTCRPVAGHRQSCAEVNRELLRSMKTPENTKIRSQQQCVDI